VEAEATPPIPPIKAVAATAAQAMDRLSISLFLFI
jgi:hypothetical protein